MSEASPAAQCLELRFLLHRSVQHGLSWLLLSAKTERRTKGSGWLRERVDIKGLKRLLLSAKTERRTKGLGRFIKKQRYRALSPLYLHISMFLYFLQIAGQARDEGCTLSSLRGGWEGLLRTLRVHLPAPCPAHRDRALRMRGYSRYLPLRRSAKPAS